MVGGEVRIAGTICDVNDTLEEDPDRDRRLVLLCVGWYELESGLEDSVSRLGGSE
jgi:hypothetical protein